MDFRVENEPSKSNSPKESPRISPKSSPRKNSTPTIAEPQLQVAPVRPPSPKVSKEPFVPKPSVEPVVPTPQVDQNDSVEEFDQQNSVDEFPPRDSLNQSCDYQDRQSDLTLEETDYENLCEGDDQMRSSCAISSEALQKRQNEENNALDYIREVCSPTVSYSLQSDQWAHRKEGLELIQKYIERNTGPVKKMTEEQCNQEFTWICIILRKYFIDRVAPVFYASYDCFRALLKVYAPYVHGREIESLLGSLIQPLLQNLGGESTGTNKRTQKEACRCILRIARLTSIDGLGLILNMLKDDTSSKQDVVIGIKQKLILLKILINEFSISESSNGNYDAGISSDLVLSICQVGINHSDDKIRKSAVEIMGMTYQRVGKSIKMYITDVKPAMLKVLEKKFTEIDAMNGSNGGGGPNNFSASFSSSFNESITEATSKPKSKKVENIRNLAPVVIKNSANSMSSRNRLLSSTMNSSFSGTAMLSTNADGEENFVVMKNPADKRDRELNTSLSSSLSTPLLPRDSKALNPATSGNFDKENTATSTMKSPVIKPVRNGNSTPGTNGNSSSKSRFDISDELDVASSPMASKKEKKGGNKGNQLKPQAQKNIEDNRFYIDESQF